MKLLELRRHSRRGDDGNLTPAGMALAERVGAAMSRFDRVWSSPRPRAVQTAEAFSRGVPAIDSRLDLPASMPNDLEPLGRRGVEALVELAAALPEGGAGLVVTHGGLLEPIVVAAMGGPFDLGRLGGNFAECEGARLRIENGAVAAVDLIRLA